MTSLAALADRLHESRDLRQVLDHAFFRRCGSGDFGRRSVEAFVSQYWHPIHFFPTFLASVVASGPTTAMQTTVSRILWQELGSGNVDDSHEALYITTMEGAGFDPAKVCGTAANAATASLIDEYRAGCTGFEAGLGALYATEAIDLTIVDGLGAAVASVCSAGTPLPWVDIHRLQEPDHTDTADKAVDLVLTDEQSDRTLAAAEALWLRWAGFFDALLDVEDHADDLVSTPQ